MATPLQAQAQAEAQKSAPTTAAEWQVAAREDVLAAYASYVRNHPGIYDLANPGFPALLAQAREAGLKAAERADGKLGYRTALAAFSGVLQDGHAVAIVPGSDGEGEAQWPGFVALWRGDALYARTPDPADPLDGARITGCDGQPIEGFLRDALLTGYFRPDEAGQWWYRPSQLFLAASGRTGDEPRACTFTLKSGAAETRSLEWQALGAEDRSFGRALIYGDEQPTKLSEPRPGIFFIGLQDFAPDEAGMADFRELYRAVAARRGELKEARALVLDLRHNNGGSSLWSYDLAKALWGNEAVEQRDDAAISVEWRASADNTAYLQSLVEELRSNGQDEILPLVEEISAGMQAALNKGDPFYVEADQPGPNEHSGAETVDSDFTTPVYVITWGGCASACLDALDYFTRFTDTKLIGAPTGADSTYLEVREEDLPAGPGTLVIPIKAYVGRPRASGEYYTPDIEMTALDWSTDSFLDRIEQDLGGK